MLASFLRPCQILCLAWLSVSLLAPSFVQAQQSSSTENTSSADSAPALTATSETQANSEDEQLTSPSADRRAATPSNSLTLTELAPILRNPWVGVGGGLLLMLLLRFVYNYGRR